MAETNGQKQDTFPDLREKLDDLSKKLVDWQKNLHPPRETIEDKKLDREEALEKINVLLQLIKSEINVYWGPKADPDNEVRILIADKHTNPWRKQVEDIEGDVGRMQGI